MQLQVNLGATVNAIIAGHSAVNGAVIPDTAKIALTSNDPTVATVPATVPVPAGGAQSITVPVTLTATVAGSTDIHVTVTAADGSKFEDTATLLVAVVAPGLASVTLTLVDTTQPTP